ncbi:hypothetical protein D3C72_1067640 [compost metagenome]
MTPHIGVDPAIQSAEVRQQKPERAFGKIGRAGVLEGHAGNEDLPAAFPLAPAQFAAPPDLQFPLGRRRAPPRTQQELPQVLLPYAEVQTQPQHQERPDRLRGGPGIAPLFGHAAQDLLRDLAILPDRARRFENGQDGFKGIPMDPGDPLNLLGSGQGMAMHLLAGAVPIRTDSIDLLLCDNAGNGSEPIRQPRALPQPPRLAAREGRAEQEHLALPAGEETPASLAPLHVPVPDCRQDEQPEGQVLPGHAQPADLVVRQGGQGAEQQSQMLLALRRRLRSPDAGALIADVRERRRLEPQEGVHLAPELCRGGQIGRPASVKAKREPMLRNR